MIILYILAAYLLVNFAMRVAAHPYPETMKLVNFIAFVVVLYRLLKKPLLSAIDKKISDIEELLNETKASLEAAKQKHKEASARLAGADEEVSKLLARARELGQIEKELLIENGEKRAERIVQEAHRTLEGRFREAKLAVQKEIAARCVKRSREKIAQMLNAEMHLALIRSRIASIGERV